MHTVPLKIIELQGDGYHILVEVQIFDQTFELVVDTGASKTVLDKNTLMEIGIAEEEFKSIDVLSTGLGTTTMQSYMLTLPYLQIGEWKKTNFSVAVLDLATINYAYRQMDLPPVIGVLGGDILVNYAARIDYRKATMKLNLRKSKSKKSALNV